MELDTNSTQSTKSDGLGQSGKVNPIVEAYEELLKTDIIDLIGGKNFTEEQREELYKKMLDTIMNRVIVKVSEKLPDDDFAELEKMLEEGDKDKINKFFEDKNIDIKQMFVEEALVYKVEMVTLTSQGGNNG